MSQSLSSGNDEGKKKQGIIMRQMPEGSNPQCDEKGDAYRMTIAIGRRMPLLYLPCRTNVAISHHTSVFPSFYTVLQPASAPNECVSPTSPILPSQVEVSTHRTSLT